MATSITISKLTKEQQQLIMDYYPLIIKLAKTIWRIMGGTVPLEDLRYHAILGACKAASTFDPSLGFQFSTYVWTCSRRSMIQYIRTDAVHRRVNYMIPFSQIEGFTKGRESWQIAAPLENDNDSNDNKQLLKRIQEAMPPRWWYMLTCYYQDGKTYRQIGYEYGISYQSVGRTIRRAIRRARKVLPKEVLQ